MVTSYRDLVVWQKAMELAGEMYELTEKLPGTEQYGLVAQLRRAAVSVPSNIAEGHARDSTKEYRRFLSIALGSIAELETQLMLCERLRLMQTPETANALASTDEIGRMLRGLRRAVADRLP